MKHYLKCLLSIYFFARSRLMYLLNGMKSCSVALGGSWQLGSKQMNDIVSKENGFQQEIDQKCFCVGFPTLFQRQRYLFLYLCTRATRLSRGFYLACRLGSTGMREDPGNDREVEGFCAAATDYSYRLLFFFWRILTCSWDSEGVLGLRS